MYPFNSFNFWDNIYATPFHYLEMLFAFFAAIAFLLFLRGFLAGIGNIFKMNGHDEHLDHARVRQVWGVMLLAVLFIIWEMVRTVASWLGFNDGGQTYLGYWFALIIAVVFIFRFIKKELFSGGGGH
jgi:hypothetical protein